MSYSQTPLPVRPRQQKLAFARNDLWEQLPQTVHEECQQLLQQILVKVLCHPKPEGSLDDEREDKS
jgi:hypothetical protein